MIVPPHVLWTILGEAPKSTSPDGWTVTIFVENNDGNFHTVDGLLFFPSSHLYNYTTEFFYLITFGCVTSSQNFTKKIFYLLSWGLGIDHIVSQEPFLLLPQVPTKPPFRTNQEDGNGPLDPHPSPTTPSPVTQKDSPTAPSSGTSWRSTCDASQGSFGPRLPTQSRLSVLNSFGSPAEDSTPLWTYRPETIPLLGLYGDVDETYVLDTG